MTTPPPTPARATPTARWPLLVVGCAVVVAGVALPRLLAPREAGAPPAQAEQPVGMPAAPAVNEGALLARVAGSTAAVLALLVMTLLLLRQRLARTAAAGPSGGDLQVLGAARLDARSQVFLVQARGHRLLVGADHGGVRMLVDVPPPRDGG